MPPITDLTQLTRSIMLGVSIGTVALTQVGCTEEQLAQAVMLGEQEACARALASKAAADANLVLERFSGSQCIPSLLAALPPATLAALSPAAVAGVDADILSALSPEVRAQLPIPAPPRVPVSAITRDDDRDGY